HRPARAGDAESVWRRRVNSRPTLRGAQASPGEAGAGPLAALRSEGRPLAGSELAAQPYLGFDPPGIAGMDAIETFMAQSVAAVVAFVIASASLPRAVAMSWALSANFLAEAATQAASLHAHVAVW